MTTQVGTNPTAEKLSADDLISRLRRLDACVVSDALDALGRTGVVDGIAPVWEGASVAGRAYPVQLKAGPAPAGSPPVHLGARAIAGAGPDDVIVMANEGRVEMGAWGGLLSVAARERGVAGTIVDGASRDVDEARMLAYPVFARRAAVRTARGRIHETDSYTPVIFAGVPVRPGDYVIADGSGVVVLAAADAARVVERAESLVAKEARMQSALRAGAAVTDVLSGAYEHMLGSAKDGER